MWKNLVCVVILLTALAFGLFHSSSPAYVGSRQLEVTITTDAFNRNGWTTITQGGKLSNFRLNPVVFWSHRSGTEPIGRVVNLRVLRRRIIATVEFFNTHRGRKYYRMYQSGQLNAWSIGIRPLVTSFDANGRVFEEWDLLELSAVTIPANPYCVVLRPAPDRL